MRNQTMLVGLVGVVIGVLLSTAIVLAGNLNPTAGPAASDSQMYTLKQIYDRLNAGTAGTKMTAFTEPSAGPTAGTSRTLDEIMDKAPAMDNTNGAAATQVVTGKSFWGLTTGQWGTQTGTMPDNGAVDITPGAFDQVVPAGYHNGIGKVAGDEDLTAANVKWGVSIFGVTGTLRPEDLLRRVPKTGQTKCYNSGGGEISCTGTGQDGAYQAGIDPALAPTDVITEAYNTPPWGGVRFRDNGDGTVTDKLTALIWLWDANCFGAKNWAEALSAANGLASGSCSLSDGSTAGQWRLPNVNELHSLIDLTQSGPALPPGHPFWGVASPSYWTSTTFADDTWAAWLVYPPDGALGAGDKTSTNYVWPVRGGR